MQCGSHLSMLQTHLGACWKRRCRGPGQGLQEAWESAFAHLQCIRGRWSRDSALRNAWMWCQEEGWTWESGVASRIPALCCHRVSWSDHFRGGKVASCPRDPSAAGEAPCHCMILLIGGFVSWPFLSRCFFFAFSLLAFLFYEWGPAWRLKKDLKPQNVFFCMYFIKHLPPSSSSLNLTSWESKFLSWFPFWRLLAVHGMGCGCQIFLHVGACWCFI